jgi:hypothetical protein
MMCATKYCFARRAFSVMLYRLIKSTLFRFTLFALFALSVLVLSGVSICEAQTGQRGGTQREYPKEIRGYKLERVTIEPKQQDKGGAGSGSGSNDAIITFGEARVVNVSPLGVTLEIPIVVAPVKRKGRIDFLSFYDMTINGTRVEVDDYNESFDLPTEQALTLRRPITIFVATPNALVGAVQDLARPKETWPVTGVVYVFGEFKKWIFTGKRVVPVELDLQMRNPLRSDR